VDVLSQLISGAVANADSSESQLEMEVDSDKELVADAYFMLGQAYEERGQCQASIRAYEEYLGVNHGMQAYVQPRIAGCYALLYDQPAALTALALAVEGEAYPALNLELIEKLAQSHMDNGDYQEAIGLYELMTNLTDNPNILGRAVYQAGWAQILVGEIAAGYDHYLQAVEQYPQAFESYLALVDLIEAGYAVDDYDRGVVDFHAKSFEPAVFVLERYIDSNPLDSKDARLYLAWSLEQLGDSEAALMQIDAYIAKLSTEGDDEIPVDSGSIARGWLERAKLLARAGNLEDAITSYLKYLELFPEGDQAPFAAWWAAALTERLGRTAEAAELYEALAVDYSSHIDASEALYRAGLLNWLESNDDEAFRLWSKAASEYPEQQFGAASLVWLLKEQADSDLIDQEILAADLSGDTFYHLRAQHIVSNTRPYEPAQVVDLGPNPIEQFVAEAWLREAVGLEPAANVRALS